MLKLDVNTKVPAKDGNPEMVFNGSKDFPETAAEAIQLYGDTPVRDNAWANFKVRIQSNVRSWLRAGKSNEEIQTLVDGLVMGMSVKDYLHPKEVLVTPGDGKVDFPAVMWQLQKGGFKSGPLVIECLKPGNLKEITAEARKARLFLEELTESLKQIS